MFLLLVRCRKNVIIKAIRFYRVKAMLVYRGKATRV